MQPPLAQCPPPQTAWCDAAGALAQCCEAGMTWRAGADAGCVCDAKHHADAGHCCAAGERWIAPTAISHDARGRCCPEGTEGVSSRTSSTDIGVVGGSVVACCPPGQRLDAQGCYEPMPCRPTDTHYDAATRFIACDTTPVRRADSGSRQARVVIGPVGRGDAESKQVGDALRAAVPALRSCYEQALADAPSLAGIVEAELEATPDGRLQPRRVISPVGAPVDALAGCVAGVVRELRAPSGGVVRALIAFQHPATRR